MARLADGRIALLWNHPPRHRPDSGSSREELSLAFSSDECATWSPPQVVAANYGAGGRVSYPYLYERKPGELWITTMQGGLRMKINVADLGQGEIPVYKPPVAAAEAGRHHHVRRLNHGGAPRSGGESLCRRVREALQGIGSTLSVHNAGMGSNTTNNARERLARDVLAHKPRLVVIQFGINDAAVDVWKNPPATESRVPLPSTSRTSAGSSPRCASASQAHPDDDQPDALDGKLRELYGKPPYRPDEADGFDAPVLARYNEAVRKLAKELDVPLVDVHEAFIAKNPDKLLLDGMHPNDAGQQLIAELLVPVIREQLR